MATINLTAGETRNNHAGAVKSFVVEQTLDFEANPVSGSDVVQALNVQAGWFVSKLVVQRLTAEGGVAVGDFGDGADPDGFIVDLDLNATGYGASSLALTEATPNTVTGYSNGKLYTAADTIDLVPSAALDAAKVRVVAHVTDFS